MRTITVKISEGLRNELNMYVIRTGQSMSHLIRQAIRDYLQRLGIRNEESVFDVASDLAGSIMGPEDLSSNPEHLNGFGI